MLDLQISREEIIAVSESEGLILTDEDRISILLATNSIDVQACPGSGKTTLIAAKLILIAKKWRLEHRGVCVLSHTNVAKDEIISRLKNSPTKDAEKLLSYPHFIGTIQEFIHRFVALPSIRSRGVRNIIVDNDEYAKQALNLLGLRQFRWLSGTMNGLGNEEAKKGFLKTTYRKSVGNNYEINIAKRPRAWSNSEENLQRAIGELERLKQILDSRGIYLFRDMYSHAQDSCEKNSLLCKALSDRFPFVLLDEMQDTQRYQDELITHIFCSITNSAVQRFGDPDQSIFNGISDEEANLSFNGKTRDDMDYVLYKSHRFDSELSSKIKLFSFNEIPLETEIGSEQIAIRCQAHVSSGTFEHTVIVFNDESRVKVIETFAKNIKRQFATEYSNDSHFTAKVIGAVGKEVDLAEGHLRIGHYWPAYSNSRKKQIDGDGYFIDVVRHCRRGSVSDWAEKYKLLFSCVLEIMKMSGKVDPSGREFTASTLKTYLEANGNWVRFRKGCYVLISGNFVIDESIWHRLCAVLARLLCIDRFCDEAASHLAYLEQQDQLDDEPSDDNQRDELLVSLDNNKIDISNEFHIELDTIHGVKGETHDATLILETKNHVFDMEAMLPYLTGELPSHDKRNIDLPDRPHWNRRFKPNSMFIRQFYVAMSRPKHLLCLAIHADRISEDNKRILSEIGWQFEDAS